MSAGSAGPWCGRGGKHVRSLSCLVSHEWHHQSPGHHSPVESCFTPLKQTLVLGVPSRLWPISTRILECSLLFPLWRLEHHNVQVGDLDSGLQAGSANEQPVQESRE